jgi:hypothetical protein
MEVHVVHIRYGHRGIVLRHLPLVFDFIKVHIFVHMQLWTKRRIFLRRGRMVPGLYVVDMYVGEHQVSHDLARRVGNDDANAVHHLESRSKTDMRVVI